MAIILQNRHNIKLPSKFVPFNHMLGHLSEITEKFLSTVDGDWHRNSQLVKLGSTSFSELLSRT